MTNPNCTSAPLSWLVMEQYHLGELPNEEATRVQQHLASCSGCVQCMDSIANATVRLKPLPDLSTIPVATPWSLFWESHWKMGLGGLAAAALCVLAFLFVGPAASPGYPPASMGYKGGDLAIGLTRYRDEVTSENPQKFAEGDLFHVRVTCPPMGPTSWDVTVFQGGEVYFPYNNQSAINCGNQVALPGSFGLSGTQTTVVCVSVDQSVSRQQVIDNGISALPDSTVCTRIEPVK